MRDVAHCMMPEVNHRHPATLERLITHDLSIVIEQRGVDNPERLGDDPYLAQPGGRPEPFDERLGQVSVN